MHPCTQVQPLNSLFDHVIGSILVVFSALSLILFTMLAIHIHSGQKDFRVLLWGVSAGKKKLHKNKKQKTQKNVSSQSV